VPAPLGETARRIGLTPTIMSWRTIGTHTIEIAVPVAQCQRLFTPAGEELWVDGWRPNDVMPSDGRTERGMVFTTGAGLIGYPTPA